MTSGPPVPTPAYPDVFCVGIVWLIPGYGVDTWFGLNPGPGVVKVVLKAEAPIPVVPAIGENGPAENEDESKFTSAHFEFKF